MEHKDLVGRDITVGDHVAYPTVSGSSPHMCVAEVLDIIDYTYGSRRWDAKERRSYVVPQSRWKVRLQPLHYTGYRDTSDRVDGKYVADAKKPKAVTVVNVKNLVKVELPG